MRRGPKPAKAKVETKAPAVRKSRKRQTHTYPERWNGKGNDFSEKQHAEDVTTLIERLGTGSVYLVGHSRGGMVAILAARSRLNCSARWY